MDAYVDPKVRETQEAAFFEDDQPANWNHTAQMLFELPESDCRLVDLPPVNLAGRVARPAPTLVIGIGGTAARVLSQLRRSLGNQWGNAKEVPSIQFLHIDTDPRGAQEASNNDVHDLSGDEVLLLPLRRPQHYRENSQQLLHWLSRRWLYNIPRSLKTEGLRPLGRLALADQARQVGQRVRRAMVQALEPAALAKSSGTVGQGFRNDMLRVFVVASISGGTGSGMSIDIGYAIRAVLQKLGVKHAQQIGLMLHSTGRDARHGELARVNAYSWLTEFKHYLDPASPYPGDISCGLPAHGPGVAAFDHTYLVQLGESLDGAEFEQSTRAVADYIRLNLLSPASAFFDACRPLAGSQDSQDTANSHGLRSFGIYRQTAATPELHDEFATLVSEQVLANWNTTATNRDAKTVEVDNRHLMQHLKLETAAIAANVRNLIEHQLGVDPPTFLADWMKHRPATATSGPEHRLAIIDALFGQRQVDGDSNSGITLLGESPTALVAPLSEKIRENVRQAMYCLVEEPRQRLAEARRSLNWLSEHLNRVESELQRIRSAVAERLTQIRIDTSMATAAQTANARPIAAVAITPCADEYFLMRLDQVTILAAENVVQVVRADLKSLADEFTSLSREITQVASAIQRNGAARAADAGDGESEAAAKTKFANALQTKLPELAGIVDCRLQTEFLASNGGLLNTVMQGGRPRAQLLAKLHDLSRNAVLQALNGTETRGVEGAEGSDLHTAVAMATPGCLEYGGERRVLALLPQDSTSQAAAALSQSAGMEMTTLPCEASDVTICVEAANLSLEHIALDFVERRRDRIEFASRVQCRTDIAWTPLVSMEAPAADNPWETGESRHTQSQHAMCKTMVI
jgi:hypothetical protein